MFEKFEDPQRDSMKIDDRVEFYNSEKVEIDEEAMEVIIVEPNVRNNIDADEQEQH